MALIILRTTAVGNTTDLPYIGGGAGALILFDKTTAWLILYSCTYSCNPAAIDILQLYQITIAYSRTFGVGGLRVTCGAERSRIEAFFSAKTSTRRLRVVWYARALCIVVAEDFVRIWPLTSE